MQEIYEGGPSGGMAVASRAEFIRSTYVHLSVAMLSFVAISAVFHVAGLGRAMLSLLAGGKYMWLAFMGGFMVVGWLATHLADNAESNQKQLVGLSIYVLAESLIFAPLFALAAAISPAAIPAAGFITLLLVGGLTWTAFSTKKDFSFMGGFLMVGILVAFLAGLGAIFFEIPALSLTVSAAFVMLMSGLILYETSNIIHGGETNYIMATVSLFVSIFNLFTSLLHLLGFANND